MVTEAVQVDELGWAEREERRPRMESNGPCWSLGKQAGSAKETEGPNSQKLLPKLQFLF